MLVYADATFKSLRTEHSDIGFAIYLADGHDKINIIHWHSSRASLRLHWTEQAEIMAVDVALRAIENISNIMKRLLDRIIPVVALINCDTF